MNRITFSKVPFAMSAVLVASLTAGCNDHGGSGRTIVPRDASASDASTTPQPLPAPKPIVFNKYATPYAVAPAKPGPVPCPGNASWKAAPSRHEDAQASALRLARAGESSFCVYKWVGPNPPTTKDAFDQIGATPEQTVLAISGPTGPKRPIPKEVYEPLQKRFDRRASGFAAAGLERLKMLEIQKVRPKPEAVGSPALPAVRVAIIDSTPRKLGMTAPDLSGHGFAVSRVAGTLACANPNSPECQGVVVAYLALPIVDEANGDLTENWDTGGRTGTMVHLYDALNAAIDEWVKDRQKQPRLHLIINLSIGWDPIKIAEDDPSVVRIRTTLQRASCLGALIVAAAGNFTGSPGPIYPAAWESLPAPNRGQCQKLLPDGVQPAITRTTYAPLVHSVGAVDINDRRMLVNRRWGQPRLSALGAAVTVPGPDGTPTPPMSGTSMAAAIGSGISGRVWAARSDMDAAAVMQTIYDGGAVLKTGQAMERPQTEFCMGEPYGPCIRWPVHRAYLCGAMAKASRTPKPTCDDALPSEMPTWPPDTTPDPKPPQGCTLTECGIPFGPMDNQLPAGVVQHGYASCPGCTFHVGSNGLITLAGTPTSSIPRSAMAGFTAVLNTDRNPAIQIFPVFDQPMNNMPVSGMSPSTSQASITWTIQIGTIATVTSTTDLTPN